MPRMLDGKSALVTGGGGGIGRATALAMAREGARVAVADFMADAAAETVALVNAAGGQAITLTGDVTRQRDVKTMIDDTLIAYGRIDCAFNNAGIAPYQVDASGKKTADWTEEAFDRMIAVNLKGVWLCMRAEIRQMLSQGVNGQRAAPSSTPGRSPASSGSSPRRPMSPRSTVCSASLRPPRSNTPMTASG